MSEVSLVSFDNHRAVLSGLSLPSPPPTRISISGNVYQITSPRVALPPLINTAKIIMQYTGPAGRVARNIFYILKGAGTGSTSDPTWLATLAQTIKTQWQNANMHVQLAPSWSLVHVTAKDNGGTSANGTDSTAPIAGNASGSAFPPQVAVVVSWKIPEVYRGGKPRLYMPGIPVSAVTTAGDSAISATYAAAVDTAATAWLAGVNGASVSGTAISMGTVSHFTGHAVRPTPVWRTYIDVRVHERLDSQRRRNGPESLFPVTP